MSAAQYYNQQQPQQNYQPPYQEQQQYGQQQYGQQQYGQPDQHYQQQKQGGYVPPPGPPPPQNNNYGMKPSQPYAQTQNNNNNNGGYAENGGGNMYGDTAPFSQANEKTGARFAPKKRLNDPIPLALFIATIAGWAVVSAIAIKAFVNVNGLGGGFGDSSQGGTGTAVTLDYHTLYLLLCVCALGLAVAAAWMGLVRMFTKVIMEITLALTVLLNIAICIYYFYIKYWSGAIIFLVIALLSVFFYWSMRKRIPLAKLLLQTTIDISKHHPSVWVVVFLGLILQTALSVWYAFTCIAIYVKWTPGSPTCTNGTSCSSNKVAGLIFFATYCFYFTAQVAANVVLATLAGGIYGMWYYNGPRTNNGGGVPKGASWKAFVRASTLSLGSIAFGSLIVTILELIRLILQAVQQYEASEGDMVGSIVACCAACCVGCISAIVQWFNKYAYIEIALYGKPYLPAAKDTWALMKDRGIDALVNDSLVGTVILWGSYLNGFLCGLFAYLYLRFTDPSYNSQGQYTAPILLISFFIGIQLSQTVGSAIDAGVSTIFVGLGEDPMVLRDRSPGLFELIRQQYPRVVQGIPHH